MEPKRVYIEDQLDKLLDRLEALEAKVADLQTKPAGYTPDEFGDLVRVLPTTVQKWCRNCVLKANKDPQGKWRIPHSELERYQTEGLRKRRKSRFIQSPPDDPRKENEESDGVDDEDVGEDSGEFE
jgi:hypothetical protein